jgi:hypothetical protein
MDPVPSSSQASTIDDTPRKKKLRQTVTKLRTKVSRLKKCKIASKGSETRVEFVYSQLETLLPKDTAAFVKSQIRCNLLKNKKGMRWSWQDKMFALSIYYHSRKAYRILGKLFTLPCKSTLTKLLSRTQISPGFHENVLLALKSKVSTFSDKDRQCALVFDEMAIKSGLCYDRARDTMEGVEDFGIFGRSKFVANTALAFMIRGLSKKWKQSIGYFLSAGPILSKT